MDLAQAQVLLASGEMQGIQETPEKTEITTTISDRGIISSNSNQETEETTNNGTIIQEIRIHIHVTVITSSETATKETHVIGIIGAIPVLRLHLLRLHPLVIEQQQA